MGRLRTFGPRIGSREAMFVHGLGERVLRERPLPKVATAQRNSILNSYSLSAPAARPASRSLFRALPNADRFRPFMARPLTMGNAFEISSGGFLEGLAGRVRAFGRIARQAFVMSSVLVTGGFVLGDGGATKSNDSADTMVKTAGQVERAAKEQKDEGNYLAASEKYLEAGRLYLDAGEHILASVSFHEAQISATRAGDKTMPPEWSDKGMPGQVTTREHWDNVQMAGALAGEKRLPKYMELQLRTNVFVDTALSRAIRGKLSHRFEANMVLPTMKEMLDTLPPEDAAKELRGFIDNEGVKFTIKAATMWAKEKLTAETTIHEGTYPSFLNEWNRRKISIRVKARAKEIEANVSNGMKIFDRNRAEVMEHKAVLLEDVAYEIRKGTNTTPEEKELIARLLSRAVSLYIASGIAGNNDKIADRAYDAGDHFAEVGLYELAIKSFGQAVKFYSSAEQRPAKGTILTEIGKILQETGNHKKALTYFFNAATCLLHKMRPHTFAAKSFEALGLLEEALYTLETAETEANSFYNLFDNTFTTPSKGWLYAEIMLIKGRILARQGKYAEALEALSKGKTYCVGLSMAGTDSQPPDEQHLKAINDELVKIRRAPSAGSFPQ